MMCPSPSGWYDKLEAYRENFRDYFEHRAKQPHGASLNRQDVICFVRDYHFTPEQIATCTGLSLEFINEVIRRFSKECANSGTSKEINRTRRRKRG